MRRQLKFNWLFWNNLKRLFPSGYKKWLKSEKKRNFPFSDGTGEEACRARRRDQRIDDVGVGGGRHELRDATWRPPSATVGGDVIHRPSGCDVTVAAATTTSNIAPHDGTLGHV